MSDPNNPLTPRMNDIEKVSDVKNKVINGGFDFWQRGTSLAYSNANFSDFYTADRFTTVKSNHTGTVTVTQESDVPSELQNNVKYSYKTEVTGVLPSPAAADFTSIVHRFEGNMVKDLYDKEVIFSFYVKSNQIGKKSFAVRNGDSSFSYVSDYEILQVDTWERKTIKVYIDSSLGNFYTDSQRGFHIDWSLCLGSNYIANTTDEWVAGSKVISNEHVNLQTDLGNYIQITGVMAYDAEFGEDIPFQRAGRNYAEELQLCQRYFEKSYNIDVAPGTNNDNGALYTTVEVSTGNSYSNFQVQFKVTKRAIPTCTPYSTSGAAGKIINNSGDINAIVDDVGEQGFVIKNSVTTVAGNQSVQYTADAEL